MIEAGARRQILLTWGHFLFHQNSLHVLTSSPAQGWGMREQLPLSLVTKKPCPEIQFLKEPTPREVSELRRGLGLGGGLAAPEGPS